MGTDGIAYGPVPSRRFGRSLGIDNVAAKVCPYSCVYCPLGPTARMRVEPGAFAGSDAVARTVRSRLDEVARSGGRVDHLTFASKGEPTLDVALGPAIRRVRAMGKPTAVLTNGALLFREDVREGLSEADHVSIKLDAARETTWRKVNRPHLRLDFEAVLDGIRRFAFGYGGVLTTETVLVDGLNDGEDDLRATASFVAALAPATAYLSAPVRQPREAWARPASEQALARAWEIFSEFVPRAELLVGYEGSAVAATGDPARDLLSITAVQPMSGEAVEAMLQHARLRWGVVTRMVDEGDLVEVKRGPRRYFLRPLPKGPP